MRCRDDVKLKDYSYIHRPMHTLVYDIIAIAVDRVIIAAVATIIVAIERVFFNFDLVLGGCSEVWKYLYNYSYI